MKKWIIALLVFGLVSMAFGAWTPAARAQPTALWLEESPFTHSDTQFVLGETITIHVEGPEAEVYDILIVYDPFGSNVIKREWDNRTVPSSGEIVLNYDVPISAASIQSYRVEVWNDTRSTMWLSYSYTLVLYRADIEASRSSYLAGERVDLHYVCWYEKDHSLVTDGYIHWRVLDPTLSLVASGDKTINDANDAIGIFSFNLGTADPPGFYDVWMWLNDTDTGTANHVVQVFDDFLVQTLTLSVNVEELEYAPGESVRVDVDVRVGGQGVGGAEVDIIVREEGTEVDRYGVQNLVTPADGRLTHFFTLDTDISDDTNFEVEVEANLVDVTISEIDTFVVKEVPVGELDVTITFDKNVYLSGDTVIATAEVQTSGTTTADVIYHWRVFEPFGPLYLIAVQDTNVLEFDIPTDFEGTLRFDVEAKNSEGFEDSDWGNVEVEYGYLLVDAEPKEYEAGDTITVSFELVSNIMTSPTFFYTVETAGLAVESGPAGAEQFTFDIPSIPASQYDFRVVAVDEGYVVEGVDTAQQLAGFFLSFEFDKEAYSPGDTMTITYEIKARGVSTLPGTFNINYGLMNGPGYSRQTASAKGTLKYAIPDGIDEGHQLFMVSEGNTGAGAMEVVYIKSGLNPFEWARLADMPLMELLLLILVIILFVLVLRPRAPPKPAVPPAEKPAPVEEAPPEPAPVEETAGPMVINCKACGAPIELTTSKRPLEVMCPSCGETEMVQ
ncbi:MAG: hypothetical protein ACE5QF_05720 [Thermoplasmata archaeon]